MIKYIKWLVLTLIVMLVLPMLADLFIPCDAGMLASIVALMIINPIYTIMLGYACGKDIKRLSTLIIFSPMLFMLGVTLSFGYDVAFWLYTGFYLIVGVVAMLGSLSITKFSKNKEVKK